MALLPSIRQHVPAPGHMEPQRRLIEIEVPVFDRTTIPGKPMANIPLSAKFMAVAEELVSREHQERQLKQENERLQAHLIHVLGPKLERMLGRMGRSSLKEIFTGWLKVKETLHLERRAEHFENLRRQEEKEHKAMSQRFEEDLKICHMTIQELQAQVSQAQQSDQQSREEVAALTSQNESLRAQLAQAERCIANMRRDADLKAESARHDISEYTTRSRHLLKELEPFTLQASQRRRPGEGAYPTSST
eukprot:gnl/MRDRNA2_/MRDRNA2_101829_c0_seq1.p1 gnl/MRDRNA2_/MRDRNA2_101829_c0~~gnl/MRDRNA2_/MRDRNA2_101829_c0_seq1.p1  ORF type:complete len:248 (+),score=57.49 gnl/MRDRNA2_/MRDRNA2_101829_c0_seq1:61-804(+)